MHLVHLRSQLLQVLITTARKLRTKSNVAQSVESNNQRNRQKRTKKIERERDRHERDVTRGKGCHTVPRQNQKLLCHQYPWQQTQCLRQ